jgi:hypothetical protein
MFLNRLLPPHGNENGNFKGKETFRHDDLCAIAADVPAFGIVGFSGMEAMPEDRRKATPSSARLA